MSDAVKGVADAFWIIDETGVLRKKQSVLSVHTCLTILKMNIITLKLQTHTSF